MKIVLIAGGTGLIGKELEKKLILEGFEVRILTRNPKGYNHFKWDIDKQFIDLKALDNVNYIINLAGEGIADKRWTQKRKEDLYNSRILSTNLLYNYSKELPTLQAYITASGINCYGFENQTTELIEESHFGNDFISNLVKDWERAADQFSSICRVVKLRTSVVISWKGGALPKLAKPIKLGIGSPVGSGNQLISWVHIKDLVNAYIHSINTSIKGSYNIVCQNETNEIITRKIAKHFHKKIIFPNVPGFLLKVIFGDLAELLLKGINPSNEKIKKEGFEFKVKTFEEALSLKE